MPGFISNNKWEVSLYRKFETPELDKLMKTLGIEYLHVEDRVGMIKPRIIFMIINEACYTLQEGTASIEDIDMGMKLGTNYPHGPFEWATIIGVKNVYALLNSLSKELGFNNSQEFLKSFSTANIHSIFEYFAAFVC